MINMKNIVALAIMSLFLNSNFCMAQNMQQSQNYNVSNVIQSVIESQRIPAGTSIKIRMENPVNTHNSVKGDTFLATIIEDIKVQNSVVLPSGTVVRGKIGNLKKNGFLSRSGELTLNFDHIVTPIGKQVPLYAKISEVKNLTSDDVISAGGGYLEAVEKSLNRGVSVATVTTNYGVKKGLAFGHGVPVILTAPLAFTGGVAAGSTLFFAESVVALFMKGDNVKINPGDILEITLRESLDIPTN